MRAMLPDLLSIEAYKLDVELRIFRMASRT